VHTRKAGGDGYTVTNRDKWLHGRRMGNALHPIREKSTDFHDTFEDEFEDFDEVHESNHERTDGYSGRRISWPDTIRYITPDGPPMCNICKASRRGAIVSVFSGHRVRV